MEKMQELYDFSKADAALDRKLEDLKNTDTRKELVKNQNFLKASNKKVESIQEKSLQVRGEAQNLEKQIKKIEEDYDELMKDISYYSEAEDDEVSTEQLNEMKKQANDLISKSNKLGENAKALLKQITNADKELRDVLQKMIPVKKAYDELKDKYQEEQNSVGAETAELKNEVEKLKSQISPDILSEYERIKGFRRNPVSLLVNNRCQECNMQLPVSVSAKITHGTGLVCCENCGRILVIL
ncbi:MAG: hypothetical protein II780_02680 [Clostridia bacterium]|jgi:predicted  nucleic acid-binding Zn-ribbon protein|nr:hypothetical protein [Clostridia bacterium]